MRSRHIHRHSGNKIPFYLCYLLAASLLIPVMPMHTMAQRPGDLDTTFSGDGKLTDGITHASDSAQGIALQDDGKIVAACRFGKEFGVVRYNPDGSMDTSFDGDGKVVTSFSGSSYATSVAIQSDGKIVAAGSSNVAGVGYNYNFALVRYNTNGSPDTSFGEDGKVTTSIGTSSAFARSVAIQFDGKIVAAGNTEAADFALARYNTDGSLDTTFGGDGRVTTSFGTGTDIAYSVAIQSDGKVVAAGVCDIYAGTPPRLALARYSDDGTLDSSFDADGRVTTAIGTNLDSANSVAIQSDGKIVAAGFTDNDDSTNFHPDFVLVRYHSNGLLDTTFDGDGKVTTSFGTGSSSSARSAAIQSDGKIVAVGDSVGAGGNFDFTLARYNTDGSLDTTFDNDGKVTTSIGTSSGDYGRSVALQSDGRIVTAGESYDGVTDTADVAMARYNPDGSLDTSFDGDGLLTWNSGTLAGNVLNATAIQSDGKIVVVGTAIARYNPDGSPDTTFGSSGKVFLSGGEAYGVAIQPDGKIVAGGDLGIARYNIDGSPDTTFGGTGTVTIEGQLAAQVVIQPDGKIVVADRTLSDDFGAGIWRFDSDGSIDKSFGTNGRFETFAGSSLAGIQPDGKLIVNVGHLYRLNTDGTVDTSFGSCSPTVFGIFSDPYKGIQGALQPDGKILTAATIVDDATVPPIKSHFGVFRCNADGTLDTGFGSGGIVITDIGPGHDYAYSVVIQSDGKIVAAGSSLNGSTYDFALVRYDMNGSLDTTFGGGAGISTIDFTNSNDAAYGLALDEQGRAVLVGGSDGAFAMARVLLGTSSAVSVSGRVTEPDGRGLRNARVSITDQAGLTRTVTTSSLGYYSFFNVGVGTGYTVGVSSKPYRFAPRFIDVNENLKNVDFVGTE